MMDCNEPTVVITACEYDALKEDSKFLTALMALGVEDWIHFDDAIDYMAEMEECNE